MFILYRDEIKNENYLMVINKSREVKPNKLKFSGSQPDKIKMNEKLHSKNYKKVKVVITFFKFKMNYKLIINYQIIATLDY